MNQFMKKNKLTLPLLVVAVIFVLFLVGKSAYDQYEYNQLADEPVASIEGEFVGEIGPSESLSQSMFSIRAITRSGISYTVQSFSLDTEKAPAHGGEFDVTVTYKNKEIVISVPLTRSKTVEYSIGYPNEDDVIATVYNNGDLEIVGTGATMNFRNGDVPWKDEEYSYVYFGSEVTPENIDYWFSGNENLTQCKNLPKSLTSMIGTFKDDTALTKTPEFFQCENLRIMTECFSGCISIVSSDTLPVSLITADGVFYGCTSLKTPPDMSKAVSLSSIDSMFSGCTSLVECPSIPESVKSMNKTFENCANIKKAAAFPAKIESAENAYSNCSGLEEAAAIPSNMVSYSGCYSGCTDLYGILEINSNSTNCGSLLSNAVQSGRKLSLSGTSGMLIKIQKDANNEYVVLADSDAASAQADALENAG